MAEGLLSGFRALDLCDEKGFTSGKILGTMGVDVIKVEKPGGDLSRNIPPFYGNIPDPEKSLYWLSYNTDKRGITLNLETPMGKELFKRLVKNADFVLESFTPGYLDSLGLGYTDLSKINPSIILTSITPFGQKGPYSRYKASDLISGVMSGAIYIIGDPDRPPVNEVLNSTYFEASANGVLGTMIAHNYRQITHEGQHVDVSIQECAAHKDNLSLMIWQFDKQISARGKRKNAAGARSFNWLWECKDGFLFWSFFGGPMGTQANSALSRWIDEEGIENPLKQIKDWNLFDLAAVTQETVDSFEKAINILFSRYTKQEIAAESNKRGLQASVVNDPKDVVQNHHLKERNYWVPLEHSQMGLSPLFPKHFFVTNNTENFVRQRAPHIGEHNQDIFGKELGLSVNEIINLAKTGVI
jgi:crotonobetainyl-CoA:carnitine CoA-transferase CaiB-like acyl-CoA transferase